MFRSQQQQRHRQYLQLHHGGLNCGSEVCHSPLKRVPLCFAALAPHKAVLVDSVNLQQAERSALGFLCCFFGSETQEKTAASFCLQDSLVSCRKGETDGWSDSAM